MHASAGLDHNPDPCPKAMLDLHPNPDPNPKETLDPNPSPDSSPKAMLDLHPVGGLGKVTGHDHGPRRRGRG
eukprot:scaffold65295_cov21-Phaeocystis_antarctica.AAC.1